jgi:hypothetical protein
VRGLEQEVADATLHLEPAGSHDLGEPDREVGVAAQQSGEVVAPERVDALVAANTLHSAAGIKERPPYSLDLMAAPIADLRAGRTWLSTLETVAAGVTAG